MNKARAVALMALVGVGLLASRSAFAVVDLDHHPIAVDIGRLETHRLRRAQSRETTFE